MYTYSCSPLFQLMCDFFTMIGEFILLYTLVMRIVNNVTLLVCCRGPCQYPRRHLGSLQDALRCQSCEYQLNSSLCLYSFALKGMHSDLQAFHFQAVKRRPYRHYKHQTSQSDLVVFNIVNFDEGMDWRTELQPRPESVLLYCPTWIMYIYYMGGRLRHHWRSVYGREAKTSLAVTAAIGGLQRWHFVAAKCAFVLVRDAILSLWSCSRCHN